MSSTTYKLYLITIRSRPVAIVPAEDSHDAVNKYLMKTGFDSDYRYFCNYLMTNTVPSTTRTNNGWKTYLIVVDTKTIGDARLISITSQQIRSCYDVFARVGPNGINNPLLIRPTIEEVRECTGFSDAQEYELRKFCR